MAQTKSPKPKSDFQRPKADPVIRLQFDSSNLVDATYDQENKTLALNFKKSSGTYYYYDVPEEVVNGLAQAKSAGQYFTREIRHQFRYFHAQPSDNGDEPQERTGDGSSRSSGK